MSKRMTVAEALEQAGQKLQGHYGKAPIPVAELRQEASKLCGHQESSILPSDFCYNRTNAGIVFGDKPLFIYIRWGYYQYVGVKHSYNGPVFHRPKGQPERQVGEWKDGRFYPL